MTRDEIIQALASAPTWDEQLRLVAALDAHDDAIRTTAAADSSLDWADTTVRETLRPTRTLDRHTASSDWLADLETSGVHHHQAVVAEAALWFQRLDSDVKADAHEYSEQARGIARRTAGKYGEAAEEAAQSFMAYAAFLNRQVLAASGLDQVQQLVNPHEDPAETPLPQDVFDNFAPPIHEINVGVDGSQTNSLAPGAEEAMAENNGSPSGYPSQHDEGQGPTSDPMYMPASGRTGSLITDMVGSPSVAIGYVRNLNEFLAAEKGGDEEPDGDEDDLPFKGAAKPFGKSASAKAGGVDPFGRGDRVAKGGVNPTLTTPQSSPTMPRHTEPGPAVSRVPHITTEAASGLDQIQQTVNPHEDPAPTSLPVEPMWPIDQPWPEQDAGTGQPSRHDASIKTTADMFGGSDTPHAVPGGETPVANSPATTPPSANSGDYDKGMAEGRADAGAGEAPSFADASSHVSDYVRGYTEGFGQGGQQPITTPDVPASMGGDSGQPENAARIQQSMEKPLNMEASVSEKKREHAAEHGHTLPGTDKFPIETAKDLANAKHDIGRTSEPKAKVREYIDERAKALGQPGLGETKSSLTVSASLITKDVSQDDDFKRGYRYARGWMPGQDIVATGSLGEEAGIYAGVTDNTTHQRSWVSQHQAMATDFPELGERIQRHRQVTAQLQESRDDLLIRGLYVYASTSLDLDTSGPGTSADPQGSTPFNGPGTVPELRDAPGSPAAPGGGSPYNGAEPFSAPVVEDPMIQNLTAQPQASPQDQLDVSGDKGSMSKSPQSMAFRRRVQANKLALRQGNRSK